MKNKLSIVLFVLVLFIPSNIYSKSNEKYVCVDSCKVKSGPTVFSKNVLTLGYANKVNVLKEKNNWSYISTDSFFGWVPTSAITKRKVLTNSTASANAKETALAGKGMTSEIEKGFSEKTNLDFTIIDLIEKNQSTEEEVIKFINDGNLSVE